MARNRGSDPAHWWGNFIVSPRSVTRWRIGPLTLAAQRLPGEWRLGHELADDPLMDLSECTSGLGVDSLETMSAIQRVALAGESEELCLTPRPADRPIVSRPDAPLQVSAGQEVTLYVGTPLWVEVASREPGRILERVPTQRLSDTWFGPPTAAGDLCYASRSFCRLVLGEVPKRPHRAVTAVSIRNSSSAPLPILRFKLPMEQLGLFVAEDGRVWTHDILFESGEGGEFATLEIGDRAPRNAVGAQALSAPSVRPSGHRVVRAFSSLFS